MRNGPGEKNERPNQLRHERGGHKRKKETRFAANCKKRRVWVWPRGTYGRAVEHVQYYMRITRRRPAGRAPDEQDESDVQIENVF